MTITDPNEFLRQLDNGAFDGRLAEVIPQLACEDLLAICRLLLKREQADRDALPSA